MLNIPSTVKALFQTDGTHKNFRVHFPNGEMADITNDNVVSESVKFTESLCSQNTFKFGLAEASVLEFETVGIGNMYGMTIEAYCEIDCSSLSAADKASIAAGTWDGTWDSVNEVFAVPYGVFTVDSCPRNHQSMAHRQVTAYATLNYAVRNVCEFERYKNSTYISTDTYQFDLYTYLLENLGASNLSFLDAMCTKATVSMSTTSTGTYSLDGPNGSGNKHIKLTVTNVRRVDTSLTTNKGLFYVELTDDMKEMFAEAKAQVLSFAEQYGLKETYTAQGVEHRLSDRVGWGYYYGNKYSTAFGRDTPLMDSCLCYPWVGDNTGATTDRGFDFPSTIKIEVYQYSTVIDTYQRSTADVPTFYQYTPIVTSPLPPEITVSAKPTSTAHWAVGSRDGYSYVGSVDFEALLTGFAEMRGEFVKDNRSGTPEFVRLNNSSPISVGPSSYSSCWWDEYSVSPIGTVTVTCSEIGTDGVAKETTADISIGTGLSLYDMTDNDVIKGLSLSDAVTMLATYFRSRASSAAFTPIDLDMQGWPWLEAGDALQITAEDGTVVDSYALRIEMSGIQNLQSVITSQGGDIIEEV